LFIAHAYDSRMGTVVTGVCLSVSLSVFQCDISKTDVARITNLGTEMFHHVSWKPIYFRVKRSKVKVTRHKTRRRGPLHSCECWLFLVRGIVCDRGV